MGKGNPEEVDWERKLENKTGKGNRERKLRKKILRKKVLAVGFQADKGIEERTGVLDL